VSLIIVRHGRTEANASGLLLGRRLDPGLDTLGVRQAEALAGLVRGAHRAICSPLRRTRETAAFFGLPLTIDERWIEIDYGTLDGIALTDVPSATWAEWRADIDFVPGGGESLAAVGQRVRAACDELIEEASDHDIVVVSHVSPIKAAAAWALGAPDEVVWRMYCAPASVTEIGTARGMPSLHRFNVTTHLDGL
jgi:broad specificity phosphatase PhoE